MTGSKPTNVALITNTGRRVPIDLRYIGCSSGVHIWEPVIERHLAHLMSTVTAIDADVWPAGAELQLPAGPGYDDIEWGLAILRNSPILAGYLPG